MADKPKRECGDCHLCCIYFDINEPADQASGWPGLKKKAGVVCHHLTATGCDVYNRKGNVCNRYQCMWLRNQLPDELGPKVTGVIFDRVAKINTLYYMCGRLPKDLTPEYYALIERACRMGIPVHLSMPTPPESKVQRTVLNMPRCRCSNCHDRQAKVQEWLAKLARLPRSDRNTIPFEAPPRDFVTQETT